MTSSLATPAAALVGDEVKSEPGPIETPAIGSFEAGFSALVKAVAPAVVNISTETPGADLLVPIPMDRRADIPSIEGAGSGFIISQDGIVVTNNHVVEDATTITVETSDGRSLPAKLIGSDPLTDLAVLDIEGEGFPTVGFADSDTVEVGDWALAVGNPLGQGFSVSLGIVSARGRSLMGAFDDYIQTDAAINRGNSGGPLFNTQGEVVGINTAILSPTGGSIGIGFSMSSNVAKDVVAQLREHGQTRRGWLGVQIQAITPDVAKALELENTDGALIAGLLDGPAKEAGVEPGDVVVAINGNPVRNSQDLTRITANAGPEATIVLDVLRGKKIHSLPVTLGRREEAEARIEADEQEGTIEQASVFGIQVGALEDQERRALGLPRSGGVIVLDAPRASNLRAGDIILGVGQQQVFHPEGFVDMLQDAAQSGTPLVLLRILREGKPAFIALPITPETER